MMIKEDIIKDQYFNYLLSLIDEVRPYADPGITFHKLCAKLHSMPFNWSLMMDENRANDGKSMRYRFTVAYGYFGEEKILVKDILDGPCSMLEMMIALAVRIEENIMDDPAYGNRTRQWFSEMIMSLGLNGLIDWCYDESVVDKAIERFENKDFEPDGKGSLFTIKGTNRYLKDVEIWIQAMAYLNDYLGY